MQQFLQISASIVFINIVLLLGKKCWIELTDKTFVVFSDTLKKQCIEIAIYVTSILIVAWIMHQAKYGVVNIVDLHATWCRDEFALKFEVKSRWPHLYPLLIQIFGEVFKDAQFGLSVSLSFTAWLVASYFFYLLTLDSTGTQPVQNHLPTWLVFPFTLQLWLPGNTSLLACLVFASLWYWRQHRLWLFALCVAMALWTDIRALALVVPVAGSFLLKQKIMDLALWTLGLMLISILPYAHAQPRDILLAGWPLLLMSKLTKQLMVSELIVVINLLVTGVVLYVQILG